MERSKTQWFITLLCAILLTACSVSEQEQQPDALPDSLTQDSVHADTVGNKAVADVDNGSADFVVTDTTMTLRQSQFPKPTGSVINVMITGVDTRMGAYGTHADANQLVRFFLDSGMVEIISVPRDTESDAGFPDSTGLNRLTNVRANRGRRAYLAAVQKITGVGPIHYWVEFGFSQAVGLLELVGYKNNATTTLRVLRSRQAYRAGDFQRSYNQGRFIRSILLHELPKGTTLLRSLAIRLGLAMVETNLTYDVVSEIVNKMNESGFDGSADRIWVRLKPSVLLHVQAFDFDSSNIQALNKQIDSRVAHLLKDSVRTPSGSYEKRLQALISKAESTKSASGVIHLLQLPYRQRAWLQITDSARRTAYRQQICTLLEHAYRRNNNTKVADEVRDYLELEKELH